MKAFALLLLLLVLPLTGSADSLPAVGKAKRILFLGDSITYSGHYVTCLEAWLTVRHPNPQRVVINVGLPSETVSGLSEDKHAGGAFPRPDLHERLDRVLEAVRPDLVVACYGINCGIYQRADEARLQAFRDGMTKLHDKVKKAGAEIIHITPWPYDHETGRIPVKEYNEKVLGVYATWLLDQRKAGWHVIDLHGPMTAEIAKRRKLDPAFTFQRDGVHPGKEGHWFAVQVLLLAFGDPEAAAAGSGPAMLADLERGEELFGLVQERMVLLRNAWLSHTRHIRPGLKKGLPLAQAKQEAMRLGRTIERIRLGGEKR